MQVFRPECTQEDLYGQAIEPIVKEMLEGFNCTIFAYGQTGTGADLSPESWSLNRVKYAGCASLTTNSQSVNPAARNPCPLLKEALQFYGGQLIRRVAGYYGAPPQATR